MAAYFLFRQSSPTMKNYLRLTGFVAAAAVCLLAATSARADDKSDLAQQISDASTFYQTLQLTPATAVPDSVVAKAKGVLILNRWSGGLIIGGSGGNGIGLKKGADGKFSAPAFYKIGGGSLGLQIGGGNTRTIAFLMTDKGLTALTDSKLTWGGDARAVAGPNATGTSTLDDSADIVLYQQSSGLDVGASFSGVKVSTNTEGNRKFYDDPTLTPTDIFDGKVKTPDGALPLLNALDAQAAKK
jgi:SH3 domain-containing YSC84-like protein 1